MSASSPAKRGRRPVSLPPLSPADLASALKKASRIESALVEAYPVAPACFLDHSDNFTLLVAVVLSAQTTDVKVNQVTPALFRAAPTPAKMAALGADAILEHVRQVGLAKTKSQRIAALARILCDEHGGEVPRTFEELEALPGVGHKTASVVMMQAFGLPAFPVDTHIHRLACRWGCGDAKSVEMTEEALKVWFPNEGSWGELHTRIILFGREHCPSRNHDMDECLVCRFAATDEARELNSDSPKKFVAAKEHKNPYSIREVGEEGEKVAVKKEKKDTNVASNKIGVKHEPVLNVKSEKGARGGEKNGGSSGNVGQATVKEEDVAKGKSSTRKRKAPVKKSNDATAKRVARSSSSKNP